MTAPSPVVLEAVAAEPSGKSASVAWTAEPLSLAKLYADSDTAIAPHALAHVERAAVVDTAEQASAQTAAQLIAAAAYNLVAQSQADQYGKLDLLK